MELQQMRTEIERRLAEKEEEIDNLRYHMYYFADNLLKI